MYIWHDIGLTGQYQSFFESMGYARFRSNNDPQLTICKEAFCTSVCKCVRDPSPQSCVDLLCGRLYKYMRAIKDAINCKTVMKNCMNKCMCERHVQSKENAILYVVDYNESDQPAEIIMWEGMLR
jgi:hypothetical protein